MRVDKRYIILIIPWYGIKCFAAFKTSKKTELKKVVDDKCSCLTFCFYFEIRRKKIKRAFTFLLSQLDLKSSSVVNKSVKKWNKQWVKFAHTHAQPLWFGVFVIKKKWYLSCFQVFQCKCKEPCHVQQSGKVKTFFS